MMVGFSRLSLTAEQTRKLEQRVHSLLPLTNFTHPYLANQSCIFPFLACEVKSVDMSMRTGDIQNCY